MYNIGTGTMFIFISVLVLVWFLNKMKKKKCNLFYKISALTGFQNVSLFYVKYLFFNKARQ